MSALRIPSGLRPILARFEAAASASNQRIWLTGGYLRDRLLYAAPKAELDLTVADPPALLARLRRTGKETVFTLDAERETFRFVTAPGGPLAHLDLTRLRAPTIAGDLGLRDFTVNAVAAGISKGRIGSLLDPTGGAKDCRRRVLRVCGPRSISDDPLRALRGLRIAAAHGLRIEPDTLRLMRRARTGMRRVSPERVRDELFQILQGERPERPVTLALGLGLFETFGIRRPAPPVLAVLRRCVRVGSALPPRSGLRLALGESPEQTVTRLGILRLAALLRDLGLESRAETICARLALGRRSSRGVVAAANDSWPRAWYRSVQAVPREGLLERYRAGDATAAETLLVDAPDAAAARALWKRYRSARRIFGRAALLDGTTAMRELGTRAGPELGRLLAIVRRAQDLGSVRSRGGALRLARRISGGA